MHATTLRIDCHEAVATIELNRPQRANALEAAMWQELRAAMQWADETPAVHAVILRGAGKHFCAGIDLALLHDVARQTRDTDAARSREKLRRLILDLQDCLTSLERCRKPVLAAIHGACIGGAIDLACACDMRYCSRDARFSVKEIDVGMVADVGTLQRLPRLIGEGMARELAYSGREFDGNEACAMRLTNRCFDDAEQLQAGVLALARQIAAKSPLAIRGTKEMLNYARDHSIADGLNHVATWNAAMLLSADLEEAGRAMLEKRAPRFAD